MAYREKLQVIDLSDRLIAEELEALCDNEGGFITYPEFLHVTQHGPNGVHKKFKAHGQTHIEKRWGDSIALFAQQEGYLQVTEFGSGKGSLGIASVRSAVENGWNLQWKGIEIEPSLIAKTYDQFKRLGLSDNLLGVESSIDDVDLSQRNLLLFPYSLDSLSPHIFVRKDPTSYGCKFNSILGLVIKDGTLSEVFLDENDLATRGISFRDGIYEDSSGLSFNLSDWNAFYQGQKAFVPIEAFKLLHNVFSRLGEGSSVIFIDEYATNPMFRALGSINPAKELWPERFPYDTPEYENAQNCVLYHPFSIDTLHNFVMGSGFEEIHSDNEERVAAKLKGEEWTPNINVNYLCRATIAFSKTVHRPDSNIYLRLPMNYPGVD